MGRLRLFAILLIFVLTLHADEPSWLYAPNTDKYLGGVGVSSDKNRVVRHRIATISARANLVESIEVDIKSYDKITKTKVNGKLQTSYEQIIEQKAQMLLKGSFIKDSWVDDGVLYVWMVVDRDKIKSIIGQDGGV